MSRTDRAGWRVWLAALGLASCAIGCKSPGLPADPMFVSHKPVEAKPETAAPVAVAYAEPTLPPDPILILIPPSVPPSEIAQPSETPGKPRRKVPGILTNRPGDEDDGPVLQVIPPAMPLKPH